MLEEAINLISKQKEMYIIQINNLQNYTKTKAVQKVIKNIAKKIRVLDYILQVLNEQKKWGATNYEHRSETDMTQITKMIEAVKAGKSLKSIELDKKDYKVEGD